MKELMNLLNIPSSFKLAELSVTSDGFYLGRAAGDIGFNRFLGKPSFKAGPGRERSRSVWRELSFSGRRRAVAQARKLGIELRSMLGKGGA